MDEGASDPSFAAFRQQLLDAVKRRDTAALLAHVDPRVRVSFGGEGGLEDFRKAWRLPSSDSPLWKELEEILRLGGSLRTGGFWAPYVYSSWPESIDAFQHVAATRAGVPIFERADAASPRVTTVDYEILEVVNDRSWRPGAAWRRVKTAGGKQGWVQSPDVRSPIGYRAGFSNRSGAWKLEALVAGD